MEKMSKKQGIWSVMDERVSEHSKQQKERIQTRCLCLGHDGQQEMGVSKRVDEGKRCLKPVEIA